MRFVRKKILQLLIVLLSVTFLSFLLLELIPGDPATRICGIAGSECIAEKRAELNLDDPMPVRYVRWLGDAVTGDLGQSARNQQPVWEALKQRLPVTI
jgi:peptide/nickel transport system permease protein